MPSSDPVATAQFAPKRTDWLVIGLLFAAGLSSAMQFAKVSPVMVEIGASFGFTLVEKGFAVSVLGIVGLVFAIAAGAAVAAIGLKSAILMALGAGAIFAALGAIAPSGPLFMVSRVAEGFSHLFIVVSAPALMAAHALEKDRPIALAIWGCFFGVGFALISAAAPPIVQGFGWRGLMLAHAGLMAFLFLAVAVALSRSGYNVAGSGLFSVREVIDTHRRVYTSGPPFILALCFCAYTIQFLAILTFLVIYLTDVSGYTLAEAGATVSVLSLTNLASTLGAGVLKRRGVSFHLGMIAAFALAIVATLVLFGLQPTGTLALVAATGLMLAHGLLPGFVFSTVPDVAPGPAHAALAFGAIAQFGNVGTFAGTPLFAFAYENANWWGGALFLLACCLAGMLAVMICAGSMTRRNILPA